MTSKPFRFAVQAVPQNGDQWLGVARRAENLGYSSLLTADGLQLMSPVPALALAAGATKTLRVGTFVLASPLRQPRLTAWDAHALSLLSGGRFEFGIGTGRPEVVQQAAELTGEPPLRAAQRLALTEQAIDELRGFDGADHHTPVMVAAAGPKALELAAAKADIVTIATGPLAERSEVAKLVAHTRQAAGARADAIEFINPIFVVGDELPPWITQLVTQFLRTDHATLIERESLQILRGSTQEMADELQRRRNALGISYVSVNAAFTDIFAPVVELLNGR